MYGARGNDLNNRLKSHIGCNTESSARSKPAHLGSSYPGVCHQTQNSLASFFGPSAWKIGPLSASVSWVAQEDKGALLQSESGNWELSTFPDLAQVLTGWAMERVEARKPEIVCSLSPAFSIYPVF